MHWTRRERPVCIPNIICAAPVMCVLAHRTNRAFMKRTISLSTLAILLFLLVYGLGYWSGFSHAQRGMRVIIARDISGTSDSQRSGKYDPYFTRRNLIPDKLK